MGAAAGPLSAGATALSAFGSISGGYNKGANDIEQGNDTAQSDYFKSAQLQEASEYGTAKAAQTDAMMRDNLAASLANIQAIRASANTATDSPTGQAILARTQYVGDTQRQTVVDNITRQARSDAEAAQLYGNSGERAQQRGYDNADADITSGWLSGGGALLKGVSGFNFSGGGGSGGGGGGS